MLVDIHCHLDHPLFKDLDRIVASAKKAGVVSIITNGIDRKSNRLSLELARKYDVVKAALGIYPRSALKRELASGESAWTVEDFNVDEEIEFIRENKGRIVAVGEVGLDYDKIKDNEQKVVFEKMIKLGEKIKKPLIVHSRKAEQEVVEMLGSSSNRRVVMHCFFGNRELVKRIIDNGWFFSIPTNVVRSSQLQLLVKLCPLNQLLTETDAPYLSPFPNKTNEPAFITESIKKMAEIKGLNVKEMENIIFANYQRVFQG